MTPDEIRAEFERFILSEGYSRFSLEEFKAPYSTENMAGQYIDSRVRLAWLAYSAAHASAAGRYAPVVTAAAKLLAHSREIPPSIHDNDAHTGYCLRQLAAEDALDEALASLKGEK